jgi:hypothetical protein
VDKANVLDVSQLWRDVVIETHKDAKYSGITLEHMYFFFLYSVFPFYLHCFTVQGPQALGHDPRAHVFCFWSVFGGFFFGCDLFCSSATQLSWCL